MTVKLNKDTQGTTPLVPLGLLNPAQDGTQKAIVRSLEFAERFEMSKERDLFKHCPGVELNGLHAEIVERELKRFLCLPLFYTDEPFVPARTVDYMWHTSYLTHGATMNFAMRCMGD